MVAAGFVERSFPAGAIHRVGFAPAGEVAHTRLFTARRELVARLPDDWRARAAGQRAPGPTARSRKFGLTQCVEQPQQRKSIGLLSVGVLDRVRRAAQLDTHSPAAVHAVKAVERTGEQFAQLRFPG